MPQDERRLEILTSTPEEEEALRERQAFLEGVVASQLHRDRGGFDRTSQGRAGRTSLGSAGLVES